MGVDESSSLQKRNFVSSETSNTATTSNKRQKTIINPYLKKSTIQQHHIINTTTTHSKIPSSFSPLCTNISQVKNTTPLQSVDQNISNHNNNILLPPNKVIRNPYATNNKYKHTNNLKENFNHNSDYYSKNNNVNNFQSQEKNQIVASVAPSNKKQQHTVIGSLISLPALSSSVNISRNNNSATIISNPPIITTTTAIVEKPKKAIDSDFYGGIDWDSFFLNDGVSSSFTSSLEQKRTSPCSSSNNNTNNNIMENNIQSVNVVPSSSNDIFLTNSEVQNTNSDIIDCTEYEISAQSKQLDKEVEILLDYSLLSTNTSCVKRSSTNDNNEIDNDDVDYIKKYHTSSPATTNKDAQMNVPETTSNSSSEFVTKIHIESKPLVPEEIQVIDIDGNNNTEVPIPKYDSCSNKYTSSALSESITGNASTHSPRDSLTTEIQKDSSITKNDFFSKHDNTTTDKNQVNNNKSSTISTNIKTPPQPLPPELIYSPSRIRPISDKYTSALIHNAKLNQKLNNDWSLMPHQKDAIINTLNMRRLVLAFDMGLGKTLIGCVWAKAFKRTMPKVKIFVVCPVSLKDAWSKEANAACGLEVCKQKKDGSCSCRSSEESKKKDNDDQQQDCWNMCISSWAKIPTVKKCVKKYVVIFDEAHNMQSMESARTKNALKIVLSQQCVGCLLLTGTPMKNGKPLNLFPLLKAVRHPFGDRQKAFEKYFCAGKEIYVARGKKIWDANGSSNLDILNIHITSHVSYLTKEDCLKDLPKQTRQYRQISVCPFSELKYSVAMNELCQIYDAYQSSKLNAESSIQGEAILGAIQRVVCSQAKVDATVSISKEILENQPAVVIFTCFVKVAERIHKILTEGGWTGELFTGKTPPPKRQAMVDNFQDGLSAFFVCTFGAGGVGLTLTAASTIILVDRPWTPGETFQAEDRVRRIGQTKPVTSIWIKAFEVDEQIDKMINQKNLNSLCVVTQKKENECTEINNEENNICKPPPKISIVQLMKSLVPKTHINAVHGLQQQQQQKESTTINDYFGSPGGDSLAGGFERE